MEEKKAVLIFSIIAVLILLLDIILNIVSFVEQVKDHCSDELENNIRNYIKEHNFTEDEFTFNKIFWSSSESDLGGLGRGIGLVFLLFFDLIYIALSIIGFIFICSIYAKRIYVF